MTASDWMIILAMLIAPLLAVQVQKRIECFRERHLRKLYVFGVLMATRATRVAPEHVEALNMIDLAYYGRKILGYRYQTKAEQSITEGWKKYLDQLASTYDRIDETDSKRWLKEGEELFFELLSNMAKALGYHFDDVHLKKNIYNPIAHGEQELDQVAIRKSLVEILTGERAIPMEVTSFPVYEEAIAKQNEVQAKLVEYLDGERAVKVKFEKDT